MSRNRITLESLRTRPKEQRQMIATVSSGAVMAVLLLGWGIASSGMFAQASDSQTAAVAASDPSVMEQVVKAPDSAASTLYQTSAPTPAQTGVSDTGTVVTIPADSGSGN